MADIQPLRALHYDTALAGLLADVTAPPYDVIDPSQRKTLLQRSPFNVVAVDLPKGDPDPYAAAGQLWDGWQLQGAIVRDPEPALWPHTQTYTDPDGLLYLINRYYNPATGQFLSVDPDVATTGEPYGYAGGNPVDNADPDGLMFAFETSSGAIMTCWHPS